MIKKGILKKSLFLILFSGSVCGTDLPGIPEEEIRRAISHTVFISSHSGFCHGVLISPSKVLTAAHCVEDVKADTLEDLQVAVYTNNVDSVLPTSSALFEKAVEMRNFIVWCLVVTKNPMCPDLFKGLIIQKYNLSSQSLGSAYIHPAGKIYIHPDYKIEDNYSEDTAVIVLKNPIPLQVNTRASVGNDSYSLTNECFFIDWRNLESVYQPIQSSRDIFIRGIAQATAIREIGSRDISSKDREAIEILTLQIVTEQYNQTEDTEEKNRLSNSYFTVVEKKVHEGYSGGPIWCYGSETGLLLKGHVSLISIRDEEEFFITRGLDENLYQWIEEQE